MKQTYAAGLWLLISGLLICGCGGSSAAGPTRAQFVSEADAFCATALRSAATLKKPKSAAELLTFSEGASAIVAKLVSRLRGVAPPSSSRAAYARFLTTTGDEARTLRELEQALCAGDTAGAHAALQGLNSNLSNEEAKELRLSECSRSAAPG